MTAAATRRQMPQVLGTNTLVDNSSGGGSDGGGGGSGGVVTSRGTKPYIYGCGYTLGYT
jgi:hypothetical protein